MLPKHELLRFVYEKPEGPVYDRLYRKAGRGFYLCPRRECFFKAAKNRRMREYPRDEGHLLNMIVTAEASLLASITSVLGRGEKMGCTKTSHDMGRVFRGDVVLFSQGLPEDERQTIRDVTLGRGARCYEVPEKALPQGRVRIITGACPMTGFLHRELQKYERLSSKGQAQ